MKTKSGEGDDSDKGSIMNMTEYQPLENMARRMHTQSLEQLRAFWQGVRNSKTTDELQAMLKESSVVILTTKDHYESLLSIPPNVII
jgi:IS1 family transposase